jgi:hypothetical protein
MHGDFSLNPTHYRERVSRVLQQMGRVQLDSDWNEQTESTLRFLRGLAIDVIGYHGGPDGGFRLISDEEAFRIGWGVYYVDGIRCVNMPPTDFWESIASDEQWAEVGEGMLITDHTDSRWTETALVKGELLYLAAWERHVSAAENDEFREVALLGPDTTSRAVVVWQIRRTAAEPILALAEKLGTRLGIAKPNALKIDPLYLALNLTLRSGARLRARAAENTDMDACTISPEARYRGGENRLYRVEIHDPGVEPGVEPTFKWSPDNASIVYPVRGKIDGTKVPLESLGRDDRTAIRKNDWVEVVDDDVTLKRQPNPLLQVVDVDRQRRTVTLGAEPANNAGGDSNLHPILRRWATEPLVVKQGATTWTELSDGIEVQFSKVDAPSGGYRSGDYWLIPSRTATGDVIWPGDRDNPLAVAPHGIDEHYAPLGIVQTGRMKIQDKRWRFQPLAEPHGP